MTSDISVIIYSYKGKLLKDIVNNLIDKSSKNRTISITVIDQHPLDRKKVFTEELSCRYVHVFWDWQNSPCLYKSQHIKNSKATYSLIISDNVMMSQDWDEKLISFVEDGRIIVSGIGKLAIESNSIFYVKKIYSESNSFSLNQYIDRSMIFGLTSVIKEIQYPTYVKYNGEEEIISVDLFTRGIDIFGSPTEMYTQVGKNTLEELYVPFSINHNYNEAVGLVTKGINSFISVSGRKRTLREFNDFHSGIFKQLKPLPFGTNDVNYDPQNLNFNKVDARRYVARTKAIH